MDILRREELINIFLTYMKKEIEQQGAKINHIVFDFTPAHVDNYFSAPSKDIPDADDLKKLKEIINIDNNDFIEIFNYCKTNEYVRLYSLGSEFKVLLTDEGFYRAKQYEEDDIEKNKTQEELIYIRTNISKDAKTNDLLIEAKKFFLNDNIQLALEKIWDAFERVKSLCNKDKKESVKKICNILADDLDFNFFDNEYRILTDLGNNYQIRHFEKGKIPINSDDTKRYLFFRVLSLINLTLERIK